MNNTKDGELAKLLDSIQQWESLFDIVRIVDPIKRAVLSYSDKGVDYSDSPCYEFWARGEFCDNCISARAYLENKSFFKIDCAPKKVFSVTVVPYVLSEGTVVVEVLKDITDSLVVGEVAEQNAGQMRRLLIDLSLSAVMDGDSGLFNRRFVNERLPSEIIKSTFEGGRLSIILVKIEGLDELRSAHGEHATELIIKRCGNLIKNSLPKVRDWVAHYDDDTYIACIANTEQKSVMQLAEKMSIGIRSRMFSVRKEKFSVNCSVGVASLEDKYGLNAEQLINKAWTGI